MDDFYSVIEVAQILNISRQAVIKQINTNKLKALKVGRSYILPKSQFKSITK